MSVGNRPTLIRKPVAGRTVQSEKYIETKLNAAVEAAGGRSVKMALTGERGFPDRLLLLPCGFSVYVEVKGTGKKLDPMQVVWMYRLLDMNFEWYLLDHTDDITSIIKGP